MLKKGALFAVDLMRAYKVYNGQTDKLLNYIDSLRPLVANLTDAVLAELTGYPKRFTKALLVGDYKTALKLFETHRAEEICRKLDIQIKEKKTDKTIGSIKPEKDDLKNILKAEIEQIKSENMALSLRLDAIYQSNSWRITAPMRFIARILRNL